MVCHEEPEGDEWWQYWIRTSDLHNVNVVTTWRFFDSRFDKRNEAN